MSILTDENDLSHSLATENESLDNFLRSGGQNPSQGPLFPPILSIPPLTNRTSLMTISSLPHTSLRKPYFHNRKVEMRSSSFRNGLFLTSTGVEAGSTPSQATINYDTIIELPRADISTPEPIMGPHGPSSGIRKHDRDETFDGAQFNLSHQQKKP